MLLPFGFAKHPNDYKSISLITIVYKSISKVLASRLEVVISDEVGDTECAFDKGKHIHCVFLLLMNVGKSIGLPTRGDWY